MREIIRAGKLEYMIEEIGLKAIKCNMIGKDAITYRLLCNSVIQSKRFKILIRNHLRILLAFYKTLD